MKDDRHRAPRLRDADLGATIGKKGYHRKLEKLQTRLMKIQQAYLFSGDSAVIVFEGWDAAGKGGTIRRISAALDPRSFKVWPIGAPRDYYLQRHYFLRFMERLPPNGSLSVFDRSWYGRVLVERVEGLTPEKRWRQAYREIRDFESMLRDDGTRLVKLFFHISPEEQLARFEERLRNPIKRWKLTYEDFRNRERWADYADAIDEMFAETSTDHAPWTLIPSEHKRHGRIAAMHRIVEVLSDGVDLEPARLDRDTIAAADAHLDLEKELVDGLRARTE